ncbi:Ger(x)C family spore germination protein [Pueribacillus sp. YX66]|uniref:Ger(x)C family spore germination protein n=1 Tax=Pueribacillus sp. YX66 TaxID=3229242 RepID=UPI00358D193E
MRKHLYGVFVVSLVFLSGCWGIEEAERMDYVHGIGVDYKDGQVHVSLQVVNLGNLGQAETGGGSSEGNQAVIAKEKGDTVNDAIFKIYDSTQRRLFWGHLTMIVITEEALKHNKMKDIMDLIDRYRETRYRILVFSTQDENVDKLFEAVPVFDGSPVYTRITDITNTYEQSSWIKEISMREFLLHLKEPGYDSVIPAVTTTENDWTSVEKTETMIKTVGVALLHKNEFRGFITGEDVNGLRWLTEDALRINLDIHEGDKPIAEAIIIRPSFSIEPMVRDDDVIFNIQVKGQAVFNQILENKDYRFLKKEMQKNIEEEIRRTYNKALELHSDIYRLSEVLYRKDVRTWQRLAHEGKLALNENSIKVTSDISIQSSRIENKKPVIE